MLSNKKSFVVQLFRYQILPIDRFSINLDLFDDIDKLIENKNNLFDQFLSQVVDSAYKLERTEIKRVYSKENFHVLKVANLRSITRATRNLEEEKLENWPYVYMAIWNDPECQLIAVQKNKNAFTRSGTALDKVFKPINECLRGLNLSAIYDPLFEETKFWDMVNQYKARIQSVQFDMITPNMANISKELSDELKSLAKDTNATRNILRLESDDHLRLEQSNMALSGLVNYSSEGGGNVSLKVSGINKRVNTSNSIKEVYLEELNLQGDPDDIARYLKEIMKC